MIDHKPVFEFHSVFAPLIVEYIDYRETLSSNFRVSSGVLRQFDRYCIEKGITTPIITRELVDGWLMTKREDSDSTRSHRISTLKCFNDYLSAKGIKSDWIPHPGYTGRCTRYTPYIYTEEEISRIFLNADHLPRPLSDSRIDLVFPAVIRVLYGCGLRVSEALALRVKDVNLKEGFIFIENAKFNKSRNLPISHSLQNYLTWYADENSDLIGFEEQAFFFPNAKRERYSQRTIYDRFRYILNQSGIPHGDKGPRIHDLRHTFAVHSLRKNIHEGQDMYVTLPVLMAYLGHGKLSSTEYYLRLTAEVYPEFLSIADTVCASIIPEVTDYEED